MRKPVCTDPLPGSKLLERVIHGRRATVKVFPPSVDAELEMDARSDYYCASADDQLEQNG